MSDIHASYLSGNILKRGYSPKGYVTVKNQGQPVKVPVAQIEIVPPQGGTAAVKPKK